MEKQKQQVAVLVGRKAEFFDFASTLNNPKVTRSTARAETEDFIYRGFSSTQFMDGLNVSSVITFGTYFRRFTPEEVMQVRRYNCMHCGTEQ